MCNTKEDILKNVLAFFVQIMKVIWVLRLASLVKIKINKKYAKMYLKYIYLMLNIVQIHLHIYVLNTNTLQFYFWYTTLAYLKSAKFEQLILYLMHFNCAVVVLKSN